MGRGAVQSGRQERGVGGVGRVMGRGGAVQSGRQERGVMEPRKEERGKALSGNAAW